MNFIDLLSVLLTSLSLVAIFSKLLFLAPTRYGVLVMAANVFYETLAKKLGWQRWHVDAAALLFLPPAWWLLHGLSPAFLFALTFSCAWAYALNENIRMLIGKPGEQDRRFGRGSVDRRIGGWVPLPNPKLVLILRGPVWNRGGVYDLGDWPLGHSEEYQVLVLNPTILRPSLPLVYELSGGQGQFETTWLYEPPSQAPLPGEIVSGKFRLRALQCSSQPIQLLLTIGCGDYRLCEILKIRSVFDPASTVIKHVAINRWKGGARAGFAWRGDMDMYDPTTFQSEQGLRHTLELCHRWRVASSMYLSGRLSLNKNEHEVFCRYLGVDRDTDGIDRFIRFLKEEVSIDFIIDFPYNTPKKYALELGNHMYLHYDTHAAMDPANNWKNMAWIGDGKYPWQSGESGSYAEQRDNALYNVQIINETLGVTVRSWGVPGRCFDRYTARAVEAAGMEVASDSDASAWTNVMKLPAPHHPEGTERLVELTKKYPGDPDNIYKLAMLKYWMGVARRTRRAFIFMAHQHLLQHEGIAGTQATEHLLRHAIAFCKGDFYISTVYGLGWYWDRVLCPKHRKVIVKVRNAHSLEIQNIGPEFLDSVPLEVHFRNGKHLLVLVSLDPNSTQVIDLLNTLRQLHGLSGAE